MKDLHYTGEEVRGEAYQYIRLICFHRAPMPRLIQKTHVCGPNNKLPQFQSETFVAQLLCARMSAALRAARTDQALSTAARITTIVLLHCRLFFSLLHR